MLKVKNIHQYYGGSHILRDLSFEAHAGKVTVLLGRNGVGKTTLLKSLMGLAYKPGGTPIPKELYELFPVLKQMLNRRGGDLSGGQQQQLAIGRALVMRPKLLLLDEPTEGIQPSIVDEIGETLLRLRTSRGLTVVLVEQSLEFIRKLSDRVLVIQKGTFIREVAADGIAALADEFIGMETASAH